MAVMAARCRTKPSGASAKVDCATRLISCHVDEISDFLKTHHRSASVPPPQRAGHCFKIEKDGRIRAAIACGSGQNNSDLVEFIIAAIAPDYPLPQSKLISMTVGQIKVLRTYKVAFSWCDARWGTGASYRGASWYYSGEGCRNPDGHFSIWPSGYHFYWWPLVRNFDNKWNFLKMDYWEASIELASL